VRRLGDARIEALAVAIGKALAAGNGIEVVDQGQVVRAAAARLRSAFQGDRALDAAVRQRIASLKRNVPEGSREWDVLYRQYSAELSRRR